MSKEKALPFAFRKPVRRCVRRANWTSSQRAPNGDEFTRLARSGMIGQRLFHHAPHGFVLDEFVEAADAQRGQARVLADDRQLLGQPLRPSVPI